ncbi:UNVERIFIED_CONTAM: hypothetical protein FKN15_072646 [Acipenser sinensis]
MDQWICSNPDPFQTWWDGGLEDQGWCLACGESGTKWYADPSRRKKGGTACSEGNEEEGQLFLEASKGAGAVPSVGEGGAAHPSTGE